MSERFYYSFEPFYEDEYAPLVILRVIVPIISQWCVRYEAELIHPHLEGNHLVWRTQPEWHRSGHLKMDHTALAQWLEEIITWFTNESCMTTGDHEKLYLYDANDYAIGQFEEGTNVNWGVHLTEAQYQHAQQAWMAQGLPSDIFNKDDPVCVPVNHFFLKRLGVKRCMSQKQWEQQQYAS